MCSSHVTFEGAGSICGETHDVTCGSGMWDIGTCYLLNGHAGDHDYQVEPPDDYAAQRSHEDRADVLAKERAA